MGFNRIEKRIFYHATAMNGTDQAAHFVDHKRLAQDLGLLRANIPSQRARFIEPIRIHLWNLSVSASGTSGDPLTHVKIGLNRQ